MRRDSSLAAGRALLAVVAAAGATALLALAGQRALADEEAYSAYNGQQTFKTLCMNCHGVKGEGDGYLVPNLKTRPPDITQLTRGNGGEFPAERVKRSIDGRQPDPAGHRLAEMPVWGEVLLWTEPPGDEREREVNRKIGELVEYVRSLQKPVEPQREAATATPPAAATEGQR